MSNTHFVDDDVELVRDLDNDDVELLPADDDLQPGSIVPCRLEHVAPEEFAGWG